MFLSSLPSAFTLVKVGIASSIGMGIVWSINKYCRSGATAVATATTAVIENNIKIDQTVKTKRRRRHRKTKRALDPDVLPDSNNCEAVDEPHSSAINEDSIASNDSSASLE